MAILSTVRSSRWCGRGRQGCQLPPEAFPGVRDMKGASARRPAPHFKHYMPLEHFFAEVSQCMPAFVHSACVFGSFVPANAGALNATSRPRANIETSVFIAVSSIARCFGRGNNRMGLHRFLGCFRMSREISSQRQFVESADAAARAKLRGWSIHLPDPQGVGFGRRLFCAICRACRRYRELDSS